MRVLLPVIPLLGLVFILQVGLASADDMCTAVVMIPRGDVLPRTHTTNLTEYTPASASSVQRRVVGWGVSEKDWNEVWPEDNDSFWLSVTLGKSWLFRSFHYRPRPPARDPEEVFGFKSMADQNRCGAIQTRWASANKGIEMTADFFSGSPLLLDRDAFSRLGMLYGEPLPALP